MQFITDCLIRVLCYNDIQNAKAPCTNMCLVPIDNHAEMHVILNKCERQFLNLRVWQLNQNNMQVNALLYGHHAICRSRAVTDLCVYCLSERNLDLSSFVLICHSFLDHPSYYNLHVNSPAKVFFCSRG